ncbi:MAG: hypothetical protein NT154_05215 [Verrucomicrobia bacterium]|nr:hypothetical protein [Verrucomicrobiota bacterium]
MTTWAWAPQLSDRDDEESSEGGIDPLGTEPIAESLGVALSPGVRERQQHPRFVTAMAVSTWLCESFAEDEFAKDGVTPPWLVFEWYAVEGLVRSRGNTSKDLGGLPGRNKADLAIKQRVPLSARRYLKTPSVFGFHGVHRQLARNLGIERDGNLGDHGFDLLTSWTKEQGLNGFCSTAEGPGRRVVERMREALRAGLDEGRVARGGGWEGWDFFGNHLAPYEIGRREGRFLSQQLLADREGFRAEILQFLVSDQGKRVWRANHSERQFHGALLKRATPRLAELLRAIAAYEEFARLLQDAFDECLYEITRRNARVSMRDLSRLDYVQSASKRVPQIFRSVAVRVSPFEQEGKFNFKQDFGSLGERQSPQQWAKCLMDHHCRIQKEKPPEGKQPWVECYDDQTFRSRPLYLREDPPVPDSGYVHQFRTNPLWSFATDLRMIR